jgi:hypothetical protein
MRSLHLILQMDRRTRVGVYPRGDKAAAGVSGCVYAMASTADDRFHAALPAPRVGESLDAQHLDTVENRTDGFWSATEGNQGVTATAAPNGSGGPGGERCHPRSARARELSGWTIIFEALTSPAR